MQLSDIRTMLGGWLQDTTGVQWSNVKLLRTINLALRETEKHVLAVDPEAFKCTYTAATTIPATGRDNLYAWPAATFAVHEVALSSDGVSYVPLQRLTLKTARDSQRGTIGSVAGFIPYSKNHFMLWPPASTAVASGLRVIVAPTLVMASDNDDNPLPLEFETLMMLEAQKIALWDVGEPTEKVQDEINKIKSETPRFYLTASEPAFISPVVDRGY